MMIAVAVIAFGLLIGRQSLHHPVSVSVAVWWAGLFPLTFCRGRAQAFWGGFVFFGWFRFILVLPFYDQHYDFLVRLHARVDNWLGTSAFGWTDVSWEAIELTEMLLFAVGGGLFARTWYAWVDVRRKTQARSAAINR